MGDKPSVETKNVEPDVDDCNPFQCLPQNPQDVRTTADIASSSLSDHLLTNFHDTGSALPPIQSDATVNGLHHHSPESPQLSACVISSPMRKMKQSKSANHNMNGDSTTSSCQDAKRSKSVNAKLTDADWHDAGSSAVDNCVASASQHTEAAAHAATADNGLTQPVEPSSPSTSSTITVLSIVHDNNKGRRQKSGH